MFRAGLGFDIHRLSKGRPLWIGGVRIPSSVGELAHSDGDVLLHALTDAMLGAAGAGDIGEHFPDTDQRWKDCSSDVFVAEAAALVSGKGYRLINVDGTVFLEGIRLSPHKTAIARRIREILQPVWELDEDSVNVKAKTMESCDAVGARDAVAAQVAVLLARSDTSTA